MSSNFNSQDNKETLWNILNQSGAFKTGQSREEIINVFETTINTIDNQHQGNSLMNKNKAFMDMIVSALEKNKPGPIKTNVMKKDSQIDNRFNAQQNEMNSLLNPPKPTEVDFTDNNEDWNKPIGDDMDRMLSEMVKNRNLEVESIASSSSQQQKQAEKWISNEKDLKIGEDIRLEINAEQSNNNNNNNTSRKSVSWEMDNMQSRPNSQPTKAQSLLNKLKPKSMEDEHMKKINKILENKQEILSNLKK